MRRRALFLGLASVLAVPAITCEGSRLPSHAPATTERPARPTPPALTNRALHVRVRPESMEVRVGAQEQRQSIPLETPAGARIARALERQGGCASETKPTAQLLVDASVQTGTFFVVAKELLRGGWTDLRIEVSTPDGTSLVPVRFPEFCGCLAHRPERVCVHPELTLSREGAAVSFFPARAGPCRNALRHAEDADLPVKREAPLDRRHFIVEIGQDCADQPSRPLDRKLEATLRRTYALAPGCPYATLFVGPDVQWESVEQALALLTLDLGWSVTLEPNRQAADHCEAILEEPTLPPPWRGAADAAEKCSEQPMQ